MAQTRLILLSFCAALLLAAPRPLHAQAPASSVTVIGVVVDSASGAPINAARVALAAGGGGAATNALGRFALENVPLGTRRILVTRLGYQDREVLLDITDPMGGVRIAIAPDPVQLEGLSTRGATEGTLRGRVIDADTGEPVPWAPVALTRDGIREVSRRASRARSTDTDGNFEIADLALGRYVLRVERPDYAPQLISINHQVPSQPLQITLRKDNRRIAALTVLTEALEVRKNSSGGPGVSVNAAALQSSAAMFMDQFTPPGGFESDAVGRPDPITTEQTSRGAITVYVDGFKQDPGVLTTYSPKEFYRVDYIACPGGGRFMLAYTFAYIEERMQKPAMRDNIPPDLCALRDGR